MKKINLYQTWCQCLPGQSKESRKYFDLIKRTYTTPERHYHNFNHIENLIQQIQCLTLPWKEKKVLLLAAFFHDLVYIPSYGNNEKDSAEQAVQWLSNLKVEPETISEVSTIIKATANHHSKDRLCQQFLDMDLAILGVDSHSYRKYCKKIRKEYLTVPALKYAIGRKLFILKTFLRKRIFNTPDYWTKYELKARKNLILELISL